jgi:DDE_Tnp_1-associated
MDSDGTRFAVITETTSFLHYFSGLPDHRQAGKVDYPLPKVLLLILLAVLAGAEAFTDIARFGERKIARSRRRNKLGRGRNSCRSGFGRDNPRQEIVEPALRHHARTRPHVGGLTSPASQPAVSDFIGSTATKTLWL